MNNLLEIKSMNVVSDDKNKEILLEDIDFVIEEPRLVSLMGDSGSGKSLLAYAIMSKESEYKAKKNYQAFCFNGKEIENNYEKDISYIPQEPLSSLNPVINILKHFEIHARGDVSNKDDLRKKVVKLLVEVGFNDIGNLLASYPHELSGGMAQRILIALALQNNPKILIADEATSSLDAVNEKLILDLLSKISKERGLTILIITHDSRIAVNYCSDHYQIRKKRLLRFQSVQEVDKVYDEYQAILREEKIPINDRLDANNSKNEIINMNKIFFKFTESAEWTIKNLDILIKKGEALGLIGLSGSGKSTISKLITKLLNPNSGEILFKRSPIDMIKRKDYAKNVQIVFQDLFGSLNPKRSIKDILLDSFEINDLAQGAKSFDKAEKIRLDSIKMGLPPEVLDKYPMSLSGGQRQKVLILKAILSEPEFIIFDEPMSSLDIKSQSEIILIIKELMKSSNLTVLFITHDFRLIKNLCDKVMVLSDAKIVEMGLTSQVFNNPQHAETKKLLQVVK